MDTNKTILIVDDVETTLQCLKKGACGYITKPYSMEQIQLCFNP